MTSDAPDGRRTVWQRWKLVFAILIPIVTSLWGFYTMLGWSTDRYCQDACDPHTASVSSRLTCWCIDELNYAWHISDIEEGVECRMEHADFFYGAESRVCWPEYWQDTPAAPYGETPQEARIRELKRRLWLEIEDRLWGLDDPEEAP